MADVKPWVDSSVKREDMDDKTLDADTYMDDDEESDELNMSHVINDAELIRVDRDLWSAVQDMAMDEPVQVGYIREWENGNRKVFFNEMPAHHRLVPREYELNVTDDKVKNLYVFSEKAAAPFKPNLLSRNRNRRMSGSGQDGDKANQRMRRGKRIIPKSTTLYAAVQKELSLLPIKNAKFHELERAKFSELLQKEFRFTTKTSSNDTKMLGLDNMEGLLKYNTPRAKGQDSKATRMDRSLLLERLGDLFTEYKYYTLRTLKARTNQPEAYLKEVLQSIAVLVKSGPFANYWTLRPEMFETIKLAEREVGPEEEAAPAQETGSSGGEEEDDDEGDEMEDVL